jgi:hypothetical protein
MRSLAEERWKRQDRELTDKARKGTNNNALSCVVSLDFPEATT